MNTLEKHIILPWEKTKNKQKNTKPLDQPKLPIKWLKDQKVKKTRELKKLKKILIEKLEELGEYELAKALKWISMK